ncbi:MAG: DUF4142 domain-containing protein [Pseudomonadota bacterium]
MNTRPVMALAAMLVLPLAAAAAEPMKPSTAGKLLIDDDQKEFFAAAASSGMFEVKAAELALKRAEDPEVKSFAQRMLEDHRKANEELKALAQQKGVTLSTQLMGRHQTMYDELKDEQSAAAFEDAYKNAMLASHKEAVTLFDEMADDAEDADVRQFAAKTLAKLQQHGGMAKGLPDEENRDTSG